MTLPLEVLSRCRPLAGLDPPARSALAECARQVEFRPGERIVPLGQPPQRLLILTDGLAKLVGVSIGGRERVLNVYRPHDMVGSAVLLDSPESEAEVAALSRVRALAITRRDMLVVSRYHPSLIMVLAREVSRQLVSMTERLMAMTSTDVPIRLSHLLLEFADGAANDREGFVPLTPPLTHDSMAQIIGASRPHTSSVLRELEIRGAVRRGPTSKLQVLPSRLANILEHGRLDPPHRLAQRA